MKNLYLLLLVFICSIATNAQQFSPTNGPTSEMETSKFVFVEGELMFTGYGYHLLRSDNGGENWYIVTANFADNEILPTSMIRKGDYIFLTSWLGDRCYRSNDNGDSWEIISTGLPTHLGYPSSSPNRLEISGDNLIMSSMDFPAISTDMGLSWQRIDAVEEWITDGVAQLESGLYLSSQGNAIPFPEQYIYKSLDNGLSWEKLPNVPCIPSPGIAMPQGSSAFAELNGYLYSSATLNGNGLMRSNDNGETWVNVGEAYGFNVGTCIRNYDGILYFTDMFGAYKSSDEGETWETIIDASYFSDDNAGYITRHNGKIWVATGKGPISYSEATGQISAPAIPNSSIANIQAGNGVILGLQSGRLYSSINYGSNWADITGRIGDGNGVVNFSLDGNNWYALAYQNTVISLFMSADNGQNWTAINTLPGDGGGTAFFSSGSQFFAKGKGTDLKIFKSIDNSATWTEKTVTVLGDALDWNAEVQGFEKHGNLIFADIKNGFAFSEDAGETWTARRFNADGKVVGWPNNFLRLQDNGSGYQIQQSTDNGTTWTMSTDGFPNLAGVIQYAIGLGMVNGRVYVNNSMASGDLSDYPGYYYFIDEGSNSWAPAENLGQIPYNSISIAGTAEDDLYISTAGYGVWTNAANTGIEDAEGVNQFITVYPNPAKDQLYVECEFTGGLMSIMDITGRIISQTQYVNNRQEVNISALKPGIYFIAIDRTNTRYLSKFIKH